MTETDPSQMTEQRDIGPLYVYGIVAAEADLPPELLGVEERSVEAIMYGPLAAVVTSLDSDDEIGTPDNLLAHTSVLDVIGSHTAVLPMAFGTVAPSETDMVETVLEVHQDDHLAALQRLEGTVQFTVRARYLRDEVLTDLVEENSSVARLREIIAGTTEDETRQERIQLGEQIVQAFDRIRPEHADQIFDAVHPTAEDVKERDVGQVEDVVELAVLVAHQNITIFEEALEDVASQLHSRIDFQLLGPQAPYDFVGDE
ncbi:GvpL/GvpF family gas vesicle protein [Yaniella halotolerans]|uniref:GvpL/GvpF family gas vesicle protein n=1 Tax=Yaniella halotolerans TaxID=225453 RepID=UPI0003B3E3D9|nr:GvpL/GvpF family gas vesicle protein [Yaniella halotolerans]